MNDKTTGIGADTQIGIGRYRYPPLLVSIGWYPIPDTGLTLFISTVKWYRACYLRLTSLTIGYVQFCTLSNAAALFFLHTP